MVYCTVLYYIIKLYYIILYYIVLFYFIWHIILYIHILFCFILYIIWYIHIHRLCAICRDVASQSWWSQGDKCCPVAGPEVQLTDSIWGVEATFKHSWVIPQPHEAALQVLSWQIDGRPKGPRLVWKLKDDVSPWFGKCVMVVTRKCYPLVI